MLKIRALNRDSLSDEDAPVLRKELQEEIALEIYNDALRLEGTREYGKSKELFFKLINENIPQLEIQGGLPKSMCTLKFACYLNLGHIFHEEKKNIEALEYYSNASKLDQGDITLWYKIGKLSLKENRFKQSIYAFSKGLDCYDSHWPCLDAIIPLLFAVRDTVNCLFYIGKALELDPDYTKGLVLRKRIYEDNPATREFYRALNPDHKWEPPLDVEIDPIEEEKYLREVQDIIDVINEAEQALAPQPLRTIPLPEALENYTWSALSKCIRSLYEYLQYNDMSFLTFVDLDKCMSQNVNNQNVNEDVVCSQNETDNLTDKKREVEEKNVLEEKMDVTTELKRRSSQNSEENGTPVQTDNDDEQQDNEDQEERCEKSKSKGFKRKRDLLSDLRVWGWHSKRKNVRKTRPDKFYTVEDCLNQSLPSNLLRNKIVDTYLQDESMIVSDENNTFLEDKQMDDFSPIHTVPSMESYFGTNKEKDDILKLWNKVKEDCDITILVKEYVIELSKLWDIKWPQELISHYIFIHEKYSQFYQLPNIYDPENKFEDIRNDTLSILLYAELVLFSCPKCMENDRFLHIGQVQFIESAVALWELDWGTEYISVFSRIIWLRAYISRKEKNYDTAVRYLELVIFRISEKREDKFCLTLPNLNNCGYITTEVAQKILKHLHMIKSVACLEELFDKKKYDEVAEIVKSTFESDSGYPTVGKIGRPTQLGMLLHSLWFTDFDQCFLWCEVCLFESYPHYTRPSPNRPQWEAIVEKCLLMMYEIIKNKSRNVVDVLPDDKKARLTETLARIICKQIYTENSTKMPLNTVTPWLILHHLLAKDEEVSKPDLDSNEEAVPASLSILFSAHEFLGPKSWCLTSQGELLHYILDVLLDREDAYKYERLREKLDIQIEQALFCLYQHPSKKNKISRHLADHNVDPLPLTWEKSFQLYEFYAPEVLPEFNSFKNASITVDLEQLLLRITALVSPECNPSISVPKIKEYLQGKRKEMPDVIDFPHRIQAIYYLLGDYYFKLKDFVRCVDFFLMDLAINPHRVDSWACLGLSYLNQLEIKLNFCKKMRSEEEFLDRAKYAQVAFKTALNLSPDNITLWIEFASFEYMAHSFCSRYLGLESENMSMEKFTHLENRKNAFLESSRQSFEKAIALYDNDGSEPDERWLHYYILGKIAEKKQSEPNEYLSYYLTASQLLHENNATYPEKIMYNSPQHLSVEALELHYRMNASILKYLELHEGKDISHTIGTLFKRSLDALPINRKLVTMRAQKKLKKSIEVNEKINKPEEVKTIETDEKLPLSETDAEEKTDKDSSEKTDKDASEKTDKDASEKTEKDASEKTTNESKEKTSNENKEELLNESKESMPKQNEEIAKVPSEENSEQLEESTGNKRKRDDEDADERCNEHQHTISESETELKENCSKMKKIEDKKDEGEVKVVDEVILVDSEYDVILILSSDDEEIDESTCNKNEADTKSVESPKGAEHSENQLEDNSAKPPSNKSSLEKPADNQNTEVPDKSEGISKNCDNMEKRLDNDDSKIASRADKISDQIASGVDVQLILDKMMQETMKITAQQPMEIDSDTTGPDKSIEVTDNSDFNDNNKDDEKVEQDKEPKADDKTSNTKESDNDENKKSTEESTTSGSSSSSSDSSSTSDSDTDDDTSSTTSSSSSDESSSENLSKSDIIHLVERCIKGLELCVIRLPKNYKAVYRLVHLFFHYKEKKDLNKCKQLLLGEYKCYENTSITGLFSDRKNNNFFNGIWRIPSSEIDRPGSLSAHMIRCVTILLQILRTTSDFKILLDVHFQLRKSPDPDKIYIKDSERLQFSEQAISLSIQILRGSIQKVDIQDNATTKKLLQDIYRLYLRIQKYAPEKEPLFGNMMADLYKIFIKEKIPENVNVLELAIKFCQQIKIAEKQQNLIAAQNMSPQNPLTPMGPVLPSPSNVNPGGSSLKRPSGMGRPRGRPPLPKVPNQFKQQRSKNSMWKKSTIAQPNPEDYLKHYKEELVKQYSQNLNYLQNAQLAQMYSNSLLSSYMQAQQTNMLSATFLQQLSALGMTGNSMDPLQMNFSPKQYDEIMEMLRKMSNISKNESNTKRPKVSNSSDNSTVSSTSKPDPLASSSNNSEFVKKQKPSSHQADCSASTSSKVEAPTKKQKTSHNLLDSCKTSNTSQSKISSQTIKLDTSPSVSIHTVPKEIKDSLTGSCVSSISIIPKDDNQLSTEFGNILKNKTNINTDNVVNLTQSKMMENSTVNYTPSGFMETTSKKISTGNLKTSFSPQSSSSVIMPSSGPLMLPPIAPISIPNLSSPNTSKQVSPGKSSSPVAIKEPSSPLSKLKNIEATISRVPQSHPETHKKHTRTGSPVNAHLPNYAVEAGLLRFPPSLSMTPISTPPKSVSEIHQPLSLNKMSSIKSETYLPKLPSSITVTPSQPKSTSVGKSIALEMYKKTYTDHPLPKNEASMSTKESKKHSGSSMNSKTTNPNKNVPKVPTSIDLPLSRSNSVDYSKSRNTSPKPPIKKTEANLIGLPFNVDSMLQSGSKAAPKSAPSNLQYGFPQNLTAQVAHTSVITSTKISGSTALDCNISSLFAQPKSVAMDSRATLITSQNCSKKSSNTPRNSGSDLYKVDEQRPYDIQLNNIYTSVRPDLIIPKSTKGSTSVITSIIKAPVSSAYASPQTSPGKTLQEKLADKKREQASKHLFEKMGHQKSIVQQPNVTSNFGNPHSVSKILSTPSSSEVTPANIYPIASNNVFPNVSTKPSLPRRKSSSEESVIFLD